MTSINSAEDLEVYEEVGRGGFGIVYRGIIKSTQQEVAIKQIDLENDTTDITEIVKEIQIISECQTSPQITHYYTSFVRNYKLWVIMEFVNGGSIFDILKPSGVSEEATVSVIIHEILLALQFLHNQGKIHRDLKSQNILLSKTGDVKLTDFGVSTQLSSNFSRRNTTVGTPYWMAPEVIVNGGYSFKADIWSLGCCAYELYTGKPPLQINYSPMKALRLISRCEKDTDFIKLIELSSLNCSMEFKDFLSKCFRENYELRYSASKLLQHKFIMKYQSVDKHKLIKKLITRKHIWDQSNNSLRIHHFYIPTEVHNKNNNIKWSLDEPESDGALPVEKLSKQQQYLQQVKPDFTRVLTKVVNKLDTRNNLTQEQHDLLLLLNEQCINLLTYSNTNKIIICQYLKYLLKELSKTDNSKLLQKLIIPSNFKIIERLESKQLPMSPLPPPPLNPTLSSVPAYTKFDEIENSLFNSWIEGMKNKQQSNT